MLRCNDERFGLPSSADNLFIIVILNFECFSSVNANQFRSLLFRDQQNRTTLVWLLIEFLSAHLIPNFVSNGCLWKWSESSATMRSNSAFPILHIPIFIIIYRNVRTGSKLYEFSVGSVYVCVFCIPSERILIVFIFPKICLSLKRKTNEQTKRRARENNSMCVCTCWNWCVVVVGRQQLIVRKIKMQPDGRYGVRLAHALFAYAFHTEMCLSWVQTVRRRKR